LGALHLRRECTRLELPTRLGDGGHLLRLELLELSESGQTDLIARLLGRIGSGSVGEQAELGVEIVDLIRAAGSSEEFVDWDSLQRVAGWDPMDGSDHDRS